MESSGCGSRITWPSDVFFFSATKEPDNERRLSASPAIEPLVEDLPLADSCCRPRGMLRVENFDSSKTVPGTSSVSLSARIPNVRFWRPRLFETMLLLWFVPCVEGSGLVSDEGRGHDSGCRFSVDGTGFGVVGSTLMVRRGSTCEARS